MKKTALCVVVLLALCGCSVGGDDGTEGDDGSASIASTNQARAEKHWEALTGEERDLVCLQFLERAEPDYRGMLRELMSAGITQAEATEMLPTAVNECT